MAILQGSQLEQAAATLRRGELVAIPTETVYGLAGDAMNVTAVAKVFERKGRPTFDPLIVHTASADEAFALATGVPAVARTLAEAFWPGPMTLVLPKQPVVADLVTAGLGTVALRVPSHDLARQLIEAAGTPLAAPSANRFGGVSPTRAADVIAELGEDLPVLDGGPCQRGVESTVIACGANEQVRVLRLGSLTVEKIEQVVDSQVVVETFEQMVEEELPGASPGLLKRHYAPRTPMERVDQWDAVKIIPGEAIGALAFGPPPTGPFAKVEQLSVSGDLVEAATNLFNAIRRLDEADLDRIVVQPVPDRGLGRAINDRLRRAATRW